MTTTAYYRLLTSLIFSILSTFSYAEELSSEFLICEEVIFAVGSCEDLGELDFLYQAFPACSGSGFGVNVEIFDSEGNMVPNPIPNDIEYLCQDFTVYNICFGDTCISNLRLELDEGPTITPVPFESISAQNYFSDNIPRPRVDDCTRPGTSYPAGLIDYEDEFIGSCEVPRVARTWRAVDRCGTVSEVTQAFDIISNVSCNIIGPRKIPIGVESLIRSVVTPPVIPTLELNWSFENINNNWIISGSKTNPFEAFITPSGPNPRTERVLLEVVDQFECRSTCFKDFTSVISKNSRPSSKSEAGLKNVIRTSSNALLVDFQNEQISSTPFQIVDLSGRVITKGILQNGENSIDLSSEPKGLLILNYRIGEEVVSTKFVNM